MLEEAQKRLEDLFNSKHIKGNPYFSAKTGKWNVTLQDGRKYITHDLLIVQEAIDDLNED